MTGTPEPAAGELELQRRWAESRWPTPYLHPSGGGTVRVIAPGRWNRGPGPDFRGAQILDSTGRARRGDVELHLEAGAWIQHGHADDPAYQNILLHLVDGGARGRRSARTTDARIPAATPLPEPWRSVAAAPPCDGIVERTGAAAVETRLLQIAQRRFRRKTAELRHLEAPPGPGSADDRRSVLAAGLALAQPHNTAVAGRAVRRALPEADRWAAVAPQIDGTGWRRGRGALGAPGGWQDILMTLLRRWTTGASTPWRAFRELSSLPLPAAAAELRIAGMLGQGRAVQLLADAVYPMTGAWRPWAQLPGARYQRTDELRGRIDGVSRAGDPDESVEPGVGNERGNRSKPEGDRLVWRHPNTQALLELERTRCRHWACRVCPLAALDRRSPDAH
ncbi:MAG: DUF2851 family protein [Chloroflexota bacterium]|nr:DUF2851 family protein [Chloroflexota bacterium]MDE2896338.1 DUF2851 family protein [Chloroflexota bacterium]